MGQGDQKQRSMALQQRGVDFEQAVVFPSDVQAIPPGEWNEHSTFKDEYSLEIALRWLRGARNTAAHGTSLIEISYSDALMAIELVQHALVETLVRATSRLGRIGKRSELLFLLTEMSGGVRTESWYVRRNRKLDGLTPLDAVQRPGYLMRVLELEHGRQI